jgi:hypothetical protein
MPDRLAEQLQQLCDQAAKETDPTKLLELTQAINRIFDERQESLLRQKIGPCVNKPLTKADNAAGTEVRKVPRNEL